MHLADSPTCRTIREIRTRELKRTLTVIAAAGIELRRMIREGEHMPSK
jgi:hypothetical protein